MPRQETDAPPRRYALPGGGSVDLTESEVKAIWGAYTRAKIKKRPGGKEWKQHSTKAGSRCRCPECNARRAARDAPAIPPPPVQVPRRPPATPPPPRPLEERLPQRRGLRSTWMRR